MTRWLTDEQQQIWRSWIRANRQLMEVLGRDLQAEHDVSIADYEILVNLSESPNSRMRMSELAGATLSSRSRLSHQIDRMERAGYVRREDCPDDRRGLYAILTDSGWELMRKTAPFHVETVREHFFNALTAREAGSLGRLCDKLNRHLDSAN